MANLTRVIVLTLAACGVLLAPIASAAQGAPTGAWRATNECFLAAFLLTGGGRAQALYLSGERDENASWTWDGTTLRITSQSFALDSFAGHLANDRVEADYVWHDLDRDALNKQACVFERFTPPGQ